MERGGSNIRPYIAEWYNQVFLLLFQAENGQVKTVERDGKAVSENYVAVTSTQLRDKTKEVTGISIGSDDRHKYIDPLINQGIIDKARSEIRKSENIYFPVDEMGQNIFSLFANNDHRLHVINAELYPCKQLIQDSFKSTIKCREKHRDKEGVIFEKNILDIYKLEEADGKEITLDQLFEKYFSDPDTCFIEDYEERKIER